MSYELREDSIIVRHTEAMTDVLQSVASAGAFSLNMYNLNPGLPFDKGGSFPLLSGIAGNFQKYRWRRARFFYKTQSGTDTRGLVMMSFSYENDASPPSSSIILRSMSGTVQGPPWADTLATSLDCKAFHSGEPYSLVRVSDIPDLDEYDNGFLIVATQGCVPSDTEPLGSLWVEYEIELCKPRALDNVIYQRGAMTAYSVPSGTSISCFPGNGVNVMRPGLTTLSQIPGMRLLTDNTSSTTAGFHYMTVDKDMEALLSYNTPLEVKSAGAETETKSHGTITFEYGPDSPSSVPDSVVSQATQPWSFLSTLAPSAFPNSVSTSLSEVAVTLLKGYRYYCIARNNASSSNYVQSTNNPAQAMGILFTFMRLLSPSASLSLAVERARRGDPVPEHLASHAAVQQAQHEYRLMLAPQEQKLESIPEVDSDSGSDETCEDSRSYIRLELDEDKARRRRNALKKLSLKT